MFVPGEYDYLQHTHAHKRAHAHFARLLILLLLLLWLRGRRPGTPVIMRAHASERDCNTSPSFERRAPSYTRNQGVKIANRIPLI